MRLFSPMVFTICAILISLRLFACYFIFGAEANTSARAAVRRVMAKKFSFPYLGWCMHLKNVTFRERARVAAPEPSWIILFFEYPAPRWKASFYSLRNPAWIKESQEIAWQLFHCVYQTTATGMRHPGISNVTKVSPARGFSWWMRHYQNSGPFRDQSAWCQLQGRAEGANHTFLAERSTKGTSFLWAIRLIPRQWEYGCGWFQRNT